MDFPNLINQLEGDEPTNWLTKWQQDQPEGLIQGEAEPSQAVAPLAENIIPGQPNQAMLPVDGSAAPSGGFNQNQPMPGVASSDFSALNTAMPTTWAGLQPVVDAMAGGVQTWTTPQMPFQLGQPQAMAMAMAPMPAPAMSFDGVGQNQQNVAGWMDTGLAGSLQTQSIPYRPGPPGYAQGATMANTWLAGIPQSQPNLYQPPGTMNTAGTQFTFGGPAPLNYPAASMANFNAALPLAANALTTAANLNPAKPTQIPAARAGSSPSAGNKRKRRAGRKPPPPPPPPQCPHCGESQATLKLDDKRYARHIERSCSALKFRCDLCNKQLCNKDYIHTHKKKGCPVAKALHYAAQTTTSVDQTAPAPVTEGNKNNNSNQGDMSGPGLEGFPLPGWEINMS